jgi:HEAT repeat protein
MFAEAIRAVPWCDVPRLGKVLLLSTSPERRAWAARALAAAGHVSAYAYLRRALWDGDEQVRLSAVQAVGELEIGQCAGELAAVYAWSGPRVRREVMRVVTRLAGRVDFAGLLFLAAGDTDREVRMLAARAARSAGSGVTRRAESGAGRLESRSSAAGRERAGAAGFFQRRS